jgi:phosphoribosylanthranilate isomerase
VEPTARPRIKVCCISSAEEAWIAIRAGASALGLVSAMPSGPGVIGDELIAEIAARVPPGVATFLLTSSTDPARIVSQQRGAQVNTLQLVDAVEPDALRELRAELPGVALVQVIHVRGPESVDEARRVAPLVHAILLDSGNPAAAVKELGGTGRVHDWELSRRIREAVDVPVYLAGGLRSENVAEAVGRVGPFGLDVCSGVRTDGRLDADKLARFVAAATLIPG